jgi:putative thioredoxin
MTSEAQTEADRLVAAARDRLAAGEPKSARGLLEHALKNDADCAAALIELARLSLRQGQLAEAESYAQSVSPATAEHAVAGHLRAAVALVRDAAQTADEEVCRQWVDNAPAELAARYALAGHLVGKGAYAEALSHYLRVVEADRAWRDGAAAAAMRVVFGLLGEGCDLTLEYQAKLSTALA